MIDLSGGVPGVDAPNPASFEELWPYFVSYHLHPLTRAVHMAGDTLVVAGVLGVMSGRRPRFLLGCLLAAQAAAFAAHPLIEKSNPFDFSKVPAPWWFVRADARRARLQWSGRYQADVDQVRSALGLSENEVILAQRRHLRSAA